MKYYKTCVRCREKKELNLFKPNSYGGYFNRCLLCVGKKDYVPTKKQIKKCVVCGNDFLAKQKRHRFCSKNCSDYTRTIECESRLQNTYYKLRFEVFKRDNFTCRYCGRNPSDHGVSLHCDHIYPKAKGGAWVLENLVTACMECNLGKSDTLLDE